MGFYCISIREAHSLKEGVGLSYLNLTGETISKYTEHGTTMGTKMVASFANIFMSAVETEIISLSNTKPLQWKTYIDDIFSLWIVEKKEIEELIVLANGQHPTIKFTAEI